MKNRQTFAEPKRKNWQKIDAALKKMGLAHLVFDTLAQRETRVFSELDGLRHGLRAGRFTISAGNAEMIQVKTRSWHPQRRTYETQIRFVPAVTGATVAVDMSAEHAARRRERALTRELAEIDALWAERYRLASAPPRTKHGSVKGTQNETSAYPRTKHGSVKGTQNETSAYPRTKHGSVKGTQNETSAYPRTKHGSVKGTQTQDAKVVESAPLERSMVR